MLLSVREVFQLSERCFRAAGVAEGPAAAAAESLWWAEAYRGDGLSTLHDLLDGIEGIDRSAVAVTASSEVGSVLDASGQPVLFSSTPALDLCCAHAGRHGRGLASVTLAADDRTLSTLGHAAYRAAERGFLSVVVATDHQGRSRTIVAAPDRPHPLLAAAELSTPSAGYADMRAVLDAGLHERRHGPLTQAVFTDRTGTGYPVVDRRLVDRLLERALDPGGDGVDPDPGVVVVCLDPDRLAPTHGVGRRVDRAIDEAGDALDEVYRPAEMHERTRRLLENGVEVEASVWRDVFEQSSGVLAPPFEGSYRGAGFDINE